MSKNEKQNQQPQNLYDRIEHIDDANFQHRQHQLGWDIDVTRPSYCVYAIALHWVFL